MVVVVFCYVVFECYKIILVEEVLSSCLLSMKKLFFLEMFNVLFKFMILLVIYYLVFYFLGLKLSFILVVSVLMINNS